MILDTGTRKLCWSHLKKKKKHLNGNPEFPRSNQFTDMAFAINLIRRPSSLDQCIYAVGYQIHPRAILNPTKKEKKNINISSLLFTKIYSTFLESIQVGVCIKSFMRSVGKRCLKKYTEA